MGIDTFRHDNEFSKIEEASNPANKNAMAARPEEVVNPNEKLLASEKNDPKNKDSESDFRTARTFIAENSIKEKEDAKNDRPTPAELLAQLKGFSDEGTIQSKDSSVGGAQVVDGVNREIINV